MLYIPMEEDEPEMTPEERAERDEKARLAKLQQDNDYDMGLMGFGEY